MTLLNSCCGCLSLKSGTIITIVLLFVLSLFHLALVMSMVEERNFFEYEFQEKVALGMPVVIAICAIMAFYGVVKEKETMLLPILVMCIVLILNSLLSMKISGDNDATPLPIFLMMIATVFISILPPIYMWMVMFSYYQELKEQDTYKRLKEEYFKMEELHRMHEPRRSNEEIEDLIRRNYIRGIEYYQVYPQATSEHFAMQHFPHP